MVSGNDEHHEEKHGPGSGESIMGSVDSARVAWAGLSEEAKSKRSPAMIAGGHEARSVESCGGMEPTSTCDFGGGP